MEYSDIEIAQRIIFKAFMEELADTHNKREKITDYNDGDVKNLRAALNSFLDRTLPKDHKQRTIGVTTLRSYVNMCKGENKKLIYAEYILDLCSGYIDNKNEYKHIGEKYSGFRNYITRKRYSLGLSKYDVRQLVYPYKSPKKISKEPTSSSTSSYEELSYELLSNLDDNRIGEYIRYYISETNDLQSNDRINFWLGVLLLHKKQYDLAIQYLKESVRLNPVDGEYHYNLALAKFKGRRPFVLKNLEIKNILIDVNNAINFNSKERKFYCLKLTIQQDHYKRRGLRIPDYKTQFIDVNICDEGDQEYIRLLGALNL